MRDDGLLMVTAPLLSVAARAMPEQRAVPLRNGVKVTRAQISKAAQILRDGPQPICNGIKDDMPGWIDRDQQIGKSLTFEVGILPKRIYRIDRLGRARDVTFQ